jgi:Glycosyl transferases group 1
MRVMFVYWRIENAGSAQDILQYARVAKSLGHEVVMYAPPEPGVPFECSLDLQSVDAVIFVFEWNLYLFPGGDKKKAGVYRDGLMGIGHLNVAKLFSRVPRQRRVILDCDGMYNDSIQVGGDFNHPGPDASRRRIELCDSLSDKIFQPTYRPLRPNVRPFLFYAYNPEWEKPLEFEDKEYGVIYVGNNWFRWKALHRVLRAIEPIRDKVGRAALVGQDWAAMPWWVPSPLREQAYFTDAEYLRRLDIELREPITVDRVIPTMSTAIFNPVLIRPTFNYMRLVNPRMFETPAASTIPLFAIDPEHVKAIYGERATDLVLRDSDAASEQILDVLRRPAEYAEIVRDIRRHLTEKHSYAVRLEELVRIVAE